MDNLDCRPAFCGRDSIRHSECPLCEDEPLIPAAYVSAGVSEAGRDDRCLETRINILTAYGVRDDLIYLDAGWTSRKS